MHGGLAHLSLRAIAMIVGLIGTILVLLIDVLNYVVSLLASFAGGSYDSGHFLLGILVALSGAVGAFLAPTIPVLATIMLLVAGVTFFFAVGSWALIASPFLLVAGLLTLSNKQVSLPGAD